MSDFQERPKDLEAILAELSGDEKRDLVELANRHLNVLGPDKFTIGPPRQISGEWVEDES